MTLTASPATKMAGEPSLIGDRDCDLMPTKQGTKSTGKHRAVTQDVSTVLGKLTNNIRAIYMRKNKTRLT